MPSASLQSSGEWERVIPRRGLEEPLANVATTTTPRGLRLRLAVTAALLTVQLSNAAYGLITKRALKGGHGVPRPLPSTHGPFATDASSHHMRGAEGNFFGVCEEGGRASSRSPFVGR